MDWIKSPSEVPMPTQRDMIPAEPEGVSGKMRVAVDSRMKEFVATGPVLKAGPKAAFTVAAVTTAAMRARCGVNILQATRVVLLS